MFVKLKFSFPLALSLIFIFILTLFDEIQTHSTNFFSKENVIKVAIAVPVFGEKRIENFESIFFPSIQRYTRKFNYSLFYLKFSDFEIKRRTQDTNVPLLWEKYLIPNSQWASFFDFVIVIDADVYITKHAPSLEPFLLSLGSKIGVVDEYSQPTGLYKDRVAVQIANGWEDSPRAYYELAGFHLDTQYMFNGGVLIVQPKIHRDFVLREIVDKFSNMSFHHARGMHFEQAVLGYVLITQNMWASVKTEWNALWFLTRTFPGNTMTLKSFAQRNYFIHLVGGDGYSITSPLEIEDL